MADKGRCSHGLEWFLHFLQSDRIVAAETVADTPWTIPDPEGEKSMVLSAEEFRILSEDLLNALKEEHLSRDIITVYDNTFKLHFIFLDMNNLEYSSVRAIAWIEASKWVFKSAWQTMRRAMRLFDDYARTGALVPGKSYTSNRSGFALLPKWCKTPITEFVGQREKAKMSSSTIQMDITACVCFCEYLSKEGYVSFKDLSADAVKNFNVQDKHKERRRITLG